jgi:methionyl-tRNA formyltransferase
MKIIYAGTPEFAVPALEMLARSGHQVVAVYTQPDRPAGRGRNLQASPVKLCAESFGLPVEQPVSLRNEEATQKLINYQADLLVVAAYGLILPQQVLDAARLGCVNIHASLLPRWRGAAPIQRAILAGDSETGITLMQMDVGLDTGAMLAKAKIDITGQSTAAELHDQLKIMGAELLEKHLEGIQNQSIHAEKQDDALATYADKLTKQEAAIDWNLSATTVARQVRAFNPWPVSFTTFNDQPVKIWSAIACDEDSAEMPGRVIQHDRQGIKVSCAEGVLQIKELQFAGKKRQTADQILNARNLIDQSFAE